MEQHLQAGPYIGTKIQLQSLFCAALVGILAASVALAQATLPVAMVLEASGASAPALSPRQELREGTKITLQPTTQVTLLHYSACSVDTVRGGVLIVTASGIEASAEHIVADRPGPCPRIHRLSSDAAATSSGSIVMRSVVAPLYLSSDAYFSITGDLGSDVYAADVFEPGSSAGAVRLNVDGAIFKSGQPLPVGRRYLLRLMLKDRQAPIEIPFFVRSEPTSYWSILRIE